MAQDTHYQEIPEHPEKFTSGGVISRMIDGLGFRYYWASKDLTQKDLHYKATEGSRTMYETMEHIYSMSQTLVRIIVKEYEVDEDEHMDYQLLRHKTLHHIQLASATIRHMTDEEIAQLEIVYGYGKEERRYPFWYMINGQISDMLYHTGQMLTFRRLSGKPIESGLSVFLGGKRK